MAEELLSSLDILGVSDNSCIFVSIEQSTKPMVVSAISQDIETYSTLSLIVRLVDVFLLKEESEVIFTDSENTLVRKSWHPFVRIK